jgi:hypothetical protein
MDQASLQSRVLLWAALWFGLVVPFHQRGQIGLPGPSGKAGMGDRAASPSASCCPPKRGEPSSPECQETRKSKPARPSAGSCAVCFLVAQLDAPPAVSAAPSEPVNYAYYSSFHPKPPALAWGYTPYHGRSPPAA